MAGEGLTPFFNGLLMDPDAVKELRATSGSPAFAGGFGTV